jgi:peptidoglycan/xylan/chitin deacetylase (PgdA/CDA1 family)
LRLIFRCGRPAGILLLSLGFVVCGTLLLVSAETGGVEPGFGTLDEAREETGWSRFATLSGPLNSFSDGPRYSASSPTAMVGSRITSTETPARRFWATLTPMPQPTPDGKVRQIIVPILMYHHVDVPPPDADAVRRDLSVSPAEFEAQLRYLIENGYQPATLTDLIMHLQVGQPLPSKPVVITFDDGFKDQYTNAYPLLKRYGFRATFFIITCFLDESQDEYMSWAEVELLHADGMEIGSHSYTHPTLRGKSYDYIVWQVLGSKEAIEARTREPVRFFSYPSGQYDQQVIDVLRSAGHWGAVTVEPGSLHSSQKPFELRRIRVRGSYDLRDFDHWFNHWLANP